MALWKIGLRDVKHGKSLYYDISEEVWFELQDRLRRIKFNRYKPDRISWKDFKKLLAYDSEE